jgi:uncharacterized protein (TIGR00251 family)
LRLELRVIPRASRQGWGGRRGERLVVRLTATPTDGKANAALRKFLAAEFGTSTSAVTIERGEKGREKTVHIEAPRRIPDPVRTLLDLPPTAPGSS